VKMTRLSCHRFRSNEVRLWLSVIAYNLGNLWRRLVLPRRIEGWTLTSLQQKLVKTGGRLVKHARYYWLLLAESHLTRRLSGSMVRRVALLPSPAGQANARADQISAARETGAGEVCAAQVERWPVSSFGILRRDKTGLFRGPCGHPALRIRLDFDIRGGREYVSGRAKTENGNSG